MEKAKTLDKSVNKYKERAKELSCLYEIQGILNNSKASTDEICQSIVNAIPKGWQYPDICKVKIICHESICQSDNFVETPWVQRTDIKLLDETLGKIFVYYTERRSHADEGPFLKEERKLINTIAEQFALHIFYQQSKLIQTGHKHLSDEVKSESGVIFNLLKGSDPKLLSRISRKLVNYLCCRGIKDAEDLLEHFNPVYKDGGMLIKEEMNRPFQKQNSNNLMALSHDIFKVANKQLNEKDILTLIQKWIKEDRSGFLVNVLENTSSGLSGIRNAIKRYHQLSLQGLELSSQREKSFRVALIRRLLSDQPGFINIAKNFIEVDDFNDVMNRIIFPVDSHGKLGGKSSGLFLANHILSKSSRDKELLSKIKIPKTWYITSDGMINFLDYNNLEDIIEQKYKDIVQVRQEYPYIIHVFKNSHFDPEILKGLLQALDDFGNIPLVVRSSSLLEDRFGTSFAGKYKSLFISNQGTKEERLIELTDAIAEVYASTFGPDPIEYRSKHDLLDYNEGMGIMIQEVVGKKVGHYFFPAFAGVAFSHNEFRWSSRIKREDGLIRIVPGLGTRAVDRLSDDYPTLIAPGQPRLRVNVSIDEIVRYSPQNIDVINLDTRTFETIDIRTLLKEFGREYSYINQIISILKENHVRLPQAMGTDFIDDNLVVTFEGLTTRTPFIKQMSAILQILQENYNHPIDIEFAHDGQDLYLLQCRSQSYREDSKPAAIPTDLPDDKVIFSANRYISNGLIPDITYIVYIDPQNYSEISNYNDLIAVGRAVGRLNTILPKRQFILMGPGRWGSRGDIKLGVSVTYSDINNTSMLIEIARQQKGYVPDVSFGTHFFQDLVEANIRYLPLYPDDRGIIFNENFFSNAENILSPVLPEFSNLSDVIKVIDVSISTKGEVLQVLMNSELEIAVGILTEPSESEEINLFPKDAVSQVKKSDIHWRWRLRNVEGIAAQLDPVRFGVKAFYIFGSTKNANAGPSSDIDILIHFKGTNSQRENLMKWLEGWSLSLSHMNFLRTGYKTDGLLDVHIITDEDIKKKTSYAVKIGATTDAARPLVVGTTLKKSN